MTSGKIATLGSGDKILHIVRMKYSKYLNLSESINATKDTIVLIVKPTNTTLKELSTCCIIVLSFSSSTICSTTFEKGGNIYEELR